MSIIDLFPCSAIVRDPFADQLGLTYPSDLPDGSGPNNIRQTLLDGLMPYLTQAGVVQVVEEGVLYRVGRLDGVTFTAVYGSLKLGKGRGFFKVNFSGGLLDRLRDVGTFRDVVLLLGSFPHRVSRLHATCDYAVPSPPDVVEAVSAAAFAGEVQLSRKALSSTDCRAILGPGVLGSVTGTVYLGKQDRTDISAKVYDKQEERLRRGCADPGPIVRVELSLGGDLGLTLGDVLDPSGPYFKYASKTLVERPQGLREWVGQGEGYACHLSAPREYSPLDHLQRLLEQSHDIRMLVRFAVEAHKTHAGAVLARLLGERCAAYVPGV